MNGLILGSMYALIAIGFSMIYGIVRLINFAHGDIFTHRRLHHAGQRGGRRTCRFPWR